MCHEKKTSPTKSVCKKVERSIRLVHVWQGSATPNVMRVEPSKNPNHWPRCNRKTRLINTTGRVVIARRCCLTLWKSNSDSQSCIVAPFMRQANNWITRSSKAFDLSIFLRSCLHCSSFLSFSKVSTFGCVPLSFARAFPSALVHSCALSFVF